MFLPSLRSFNRLSRNAAVCLLFFGASHQTVTANELSIKTAKWESGDELLIVTGIGADRNARVQIFGQDGAPALGATRASREGKWRFRHSELAAVPCEVRAESGGDTAQKVVTDAPPDCAGAEPPPVAGNFTILANNDLGMHCADLDYRIFSILPFYNIVNAQVLQTGAEPRLMSRTDGVEVTYQAVESNILDPTNDAAPPTAIDSVNSTTHNAPGIFKGNFWTLDDDSTPIGFPAYDPLYPPGVLAMFLFEPDVGLPAPNLVELYLVSGALEAEQSTMPGRFDPYNANDPQPFHGYVEDFPFFVGDQDNDGNQDLPFGYIAEGFRRHTAEGIPISPVDDLGRSNAYPLLRVQARNTEGQLLAEVDTVVPVASEADCQGCHLAQEVCNSVGIDIPCDDIAHYYGHGATFIDEDNIATADASDPHYVPGDTPEQIALNAAKINILRLHDAKNDTMLDDERNIVCAKCHYSPALDLAHLGPNDDNGKEQTEHVSMSRAMHFFHGLLRNDRINDPEGAFAELFPIMPPPSAERLSAQEQILKETCYNCHPGKRTKCLRGAMETGGIVCQDCHGQSTQVGNDFSAGFPSGDSADFGLRVPWASEPACQSCHIGDVHQVRELQQSGALADALVNERDKSGNRDDLRLLMAYAQSAHSTEGGSDILELFAFDSSRFASNLPLYRLSGGDDGSGKGHGGVSCEGCHGSTHAIWPNANPWANDNKTAMDLQGHTGTLVECETCHEGDLGDSMNGPHGMHAVGGTGFADGGHKELADSDEDACRACHGTSGEGTVLSRVAVDRTFTIEECEHGTLCPGEKQEPFVVELQRGEPVTCTMCHENKL